MGTGCRRCAAHAVYIPRSHPRTQSQLPATAATRRFARHHLPNSLPPRSVVAWDACTRGIFPIFPRVSVFTHHARPPSPQCSSRAARPSSPHTPARFSLLASFVPYLYSTSTQPPSHAPIPLFSLSTPAPVRLPVILYNRFQSSLFPVRPFASPLRSSCLLLFPSPLLYSLFPPFVFLRRSSPPSKLLLSPYTHHHSPHPPLTALSSVSRARPLVLHSVPSSSQ